MKSLYVYTKNKFLVLPKNLMRTFYCTIYFAVTLQLFSPKARKGIKIWNLLARH